MKIQKPNVKIQINLLNPNPEFFRFVIGVLFVICYLSFVILLSPIYAAEKRSQEKFLTKGDLIEMLSTTDFVKQKMNEFLSWSVGYDVSAINQVKLVPTFNYILAVPKKLPPDGKTIFEIKASVDNPGGVENISGVRADLSSIGRLSNMTLVDNGLFGDEKAGDGIFTLQTSISRKIEEGEKTIPVSVANEKGWLAVGTTALDISKNPVIVGIEVRPLEVPADGKTQATIFVDIDNPGRIEDLASITLDLSNLGYSKTISLKYREKNVFSADFVLPRGISGGKYKAKLEAINLAGGRAISEIELRVR